MKKSKLLFGVISVIIALACGCSDNTESAESSIYKTDSLTTEQTPYTTTEPMAELTTTPSTTASAPSTTAATTTAATTTTVAPTTTTTPAPKWSETPIEPTEKYINTWVYSRTEALMGSPTADLLYLNDKVVIVAECDTGYYKLENGNYIHGDFLSDEYVVIVTTTTTTGTTTPAPTAPTNTTKAPTAKPGEYVSSGYEPLDKIIFPILDSLVTEDMSQSRKREIIYDYLVGYQYKERTLLIPQSKKEYSEQLYAISLFEKGYGICYDFSAAFKFMTRAVGMNTEMVYGEHLHNDIYFIPHSWAVINLDGTDYIFDPCMERVMINDGMSGGRYRYQKPYYWFEGYYRLP